MRTHRIELIDPAITSTRDKLRQTLKMIEMKDVKKVQGRWFPTTIIYKDMLKSGKGTEMKMADIRFDQEIPEHIFSKAALKQ